MAWRLATATEPTLRDGPRALSLALNAGMTPPSLEDLDTLAAAYAELGQFEKASQTIQTGLAQPQARINTTRAAAMQERLSQYQKGRAFRQ